MLRIGRISLTSTAVAIALAPGLGGFVASARAQTAQSGEPAKLEDVVVTARRRSESIDTVPLSITAMTSERIEERNLKTIDDVAAFSPGFFTQTQTGTGAGRNDRSFRQLTFRGIGASSTNVAVFAGGVAFLDGTPVLNSSLANVQDVERVEVLRGPQGVYFGRSTFIGAVNYITKDPTDTWTGRASAEVGQRDLVDASGAISGPVSDSASFRLSARHYRKGGQYRTSNERKVLGSQGTDAVSLTFLFKPTENLTIRPYYNYFEDSDGPPAQYTLGGRTVGPGGANCSLGGSTGAYWCGEVPQKADPSLISANLSVTPALYANLVQNARGFPIPFAYADYINDFGLKRKAHQYSTKIDYTFGGFTLTSVSAYHNERIVTFNDLGFRANPTFQFSTTVGYKDYDWSQEFRLVSPTDRRLRFVTGVNYVKLRQSTSGIIGQFGSFGVLNFAGLQVGYTQAQTPAVFAGGYFDFTPKLTLTVEGRYQADKIRGHFARSATAFIDATETFKTFSPRVSLDYKLSDTSTVYVLASRGYKPGGFNNGILTQPQFILDQFAVTGAGPVYDQEKLDNFEAGIKGSFLDGRVRAALTAYVGRYDNAQVVQPITVFTTQNPNGSPNTAGATNTFALVRSIGKADLKGLEVEGEALLAPGFRVGATAAYTEAEIKDWFCSECRNILAQNATNNVQVTSTIGKRLPGTPKIAYTLSSSYEREFSGGVFGYVGADYLYRGTYYAEAANIASSGASKTANLRIGARKGNVNVELFARNAFDNQSPSIAYGTFDSTVFPTFTSANVVRVGLPDRRRIGIRASASF